MSRGIHADTLAALESSSFEFTTLIQIDFPTVQRYTTWDRDVTALSSTFQSSRDLMSIDDVSETGEVRVNEFEIEMSGVSQTFVAVLVNSNYINTRVRMWKAVMQNDAVVGDPISVFDGFISGMKMSEDNEDSTVVIKIASHWKDFEKLSGRRTNPTSQNKHYPNDLGMEFSQDLKRDVPWGRK